MNSWNYTDDNPFPETLDTVVTVKLRNGLVFNGYTVSYWNGTFKLGQSNWKPSDSPFDIVEYKVS